MLLGLVSVTLTPPVVVPMRGLLSVELSGPKLAEIDRISVRMTNRDREHAD